MRITIAVLIHGGTVMIDLKETNYVEIVVNDENDLYTPLSPDNEFEQGVRSYIKSKIALIGYDHNIGLKVISPAPIDEERFRSAVKNWIRDEKISMEQALRESNRIMFGMLVIASVFIILSLVLSKYISVLSYTIIPVLGSVALGRAAGIFITEMPVIKAKQKMADELEMNSPVIFEQSASA